MHLFIFENFRGFYDNAIAKVDKAAFAGLQTYIVDNSLFDKIINNVLSNMNVSLELNVSRTLDKNSTSLFYNAKVGQIFT